MKIIVKYLTKWIWLILHAQKNSFANAVKV
jgi:hypothetical protein